MKQRHYLTLTILISIFNFIAVNAKNPIQGNPDHIANRIIVRLHQDVILTDSQQIKLKHLIQNYIVQYNNANENQINPLYVKYKAEMDSLLTISQKEQLKTKRNERIRNFKKKPVK